MKSARRRSARHAGRAGGPRGTGGRASPDGVALAFARDRDGRLTPVAGLDATSRRARAPFTCPGCGDVLVARLGAVRARHFAHRPGSACPLTSPETALHFNAKERLLALCAEAFSGRRRVSLLARCPTCRRVGSRDLGALGDDAAAEGAIGDRRADVLVTRAGAATLAFEVLVTHAVDEAKAAVLGSAGVPVAEIDARATWEREGPEGRVELACHRSIGFPPCPACLAQTRAEVDRDRGGEAAQIAELEAYRARGLLRPGTGRVRHAAKPLRHEAETSDTKRVKSPSPRNVSRPDPEYPADYSGSGEGEAPLTTVERDALRRCFRCPDCGAASLELGSRLASHPCPGQGSRPVAWRGYDGRLVELGWWKR